MDSSDWSNRIRYHPLDIRSDTEFKWHLKPKLFAEDQDCTQERDDPRGQHAATVNTLLLIIFHLKCPVFWISSGCGVF